MTNQNLLLCRSFAQKMINERDLSSAPQFIAANSVHHEFEAPAERLPAMRETRFVA